MQNQYAPDFVSAPGETLEDILIDHGMTQAELARRMGRPLKTVNEIVQGRTAITPETALQLERTLGISASFWMSREQHYRESLARQKEVQQLAGKVGWLDKVPVRAMIKYGWIKPVTGPIQQLREVINYFGIAAPEQLTEVYQPAMFRQSAAYRANPVAVAAWLRRGELQAHRIACEPYDEQRFRATLREIRSLTMTPPAVFQPTLTNRCAECGVAVVFVRELPKTGVYGATRWLTSSKALIQLSLRYKTNDHLWFSFFHEAGHVLLHGRRELFIEDNETINEEEQQANEFASNILIPPDDWFRVQEFVLQAGDRYPSIASIQHWASDIGIAPGILVGRLQHEKLVPMSHYNHLKEKLVWADQ